MELIKSHPIAIAFIVAMFLVIAFDEWSKHRRDKASRLEQENMDKERDARVASGMYLGGPEDFDNDIGLDGTDTFDVSDMSLENVSINIEENERAISFYLRRRRMLSDRKFQLMRK